VRDVLGPRRAGLEPEADPLAGDLVTPGLHLLAAEAGWARHAPNSFLLFGPGDGCQLEPVGLARSDEIDFADIQQSKGARHGASE
jgi:hypothetical protein